MDATAVVTLATCLLLLGGIGAIALYGLGRWHSYYLGYRAGYDAGRRASE